MNKKDLILDAMLALLSEKKGATCSVSDIAKKAGIAKGGMYYYFNSKEEVFDALVKRTYANIIQSCYAIANDKSMSELEKLKSVYVTYRSTIISNDLDAFLHVQENAAIHQKSLAEILLSLSNVISDIIEQGNKTHKFQCAYPNEVSEILMSVFCFLLDPGIFVWSPQQILQKVYVLANMIEKELNIDKGSLSFLYKPD